MLKLNDKSKKKYDTNIKRGATVCPSFLSFLDHAVDKF